MKRKPGFAMWFALFSLAVFILLGIALGTLQAKQGAMGRMALGYCSVLFLLIFPAMRMLGVAHPWRLYSVLFVFCILAYDVGCVHQGFDGYAHFDKVMHFASGILFTIMGFCVFFYISHPLPRRPGDKLLLSCTYALFFSLMVAVVWEIGEFSGYLLTGHDSQHHLDTGVFDTMYDIICCFGGSLLAVISYLLYARKGVRLLTGAVVEEFFLLNRSRKQRGRPQ